MDACLECAATAHAEVLEAKSWFQFDTQWLEGMKPGLSRRMWRLKNGTATDNLTVDARVPRPRAREARVSAPDANRVAPDTRRVGVRGECDRPLRPSWRQARCPMQNPILVIVVFR